MVRVCEFGRGREHRGAKSDVASRSGQSGRRVVIKLDERRDCMTAVAEAPRGWLPAQDTMAALSTNSAHRVLQDMTHETLITSESGAAASSQAILDVVAAVRTGTAVAKQ